MFKALNPFKSRTNTPASAKNSQPLTFNDPQQQLIAQQVERCYQIAETKLKRSFPRPEINFALRGKSAGTAHLQLNKLRFNATLLKTNHQAFIDEVVPHEICHLLAAQVFGRVKPHGREWQSLMLQVFNLQPRTTHSFDTTAVEGKTFDYFCLCGPIKLSVRRHNKVLRGETQYRCRKCGSQLQSN
ncbi:SprT family zinc-dependent metalloprotease [Shewanella sp. 1CM18E]|uniref:SprT family zinc-dependent metalloprotease n=1 Tax=Shewanella sp. 1CM18E TaxID=2929169 RepID=UPI0020BE3F95|nr:SprT family zinc-dependent metalloprotease [Shewanella sp. 1CM18E]MCK8044904.1 SprT family zinc-dependent metalloprotease [Shewanella sp. 1CM18E]